MAEGAPGYEGCDDGNLIDRDACTAQCLTARCGDGVVYVGQEECDDGNQVDNDTCRNTCEAASCGDGVRGPGEECDDGNGDDLDACSNGCRAAAVATGCANPVRLATTEIGSTRTPARTSVPRALQAMDHEDIAQGQEGFEARDDGNEDNGDTYQHLRCGAVRRRHGAHRRRSRTTEPACRPTRSTTARRRAAATGWCKTAWRAVTTPTRCKRTASLNNCTVASCGDSFVHENVEGCDDGNEVQTDACLNDCTVAPCGDGQVYAGEEACDDGNQVQTDACLNDCSAASCGDGQVQAGVEACDDGNQNNDDACRNDCTWYLGEVQGAPARTCKALLTARPGAPSRTYWLDPNGGSTDDARQVYCDMTTDGGGWS